MDEVFPVLGGIVLGLYFSQRPKNAFNVGLLVLLVILTAITASYISGELAQSWFFVLVDFAEVTAAAFAGALLARRVLGRRLPRRW